jgi:hypothetical protein
MKTCFAVFLLVLVASAASLTQAAETKFPSLSRTLTALVPSECNEWKPPVPLTRKDVGFPEEMQSLRGNATLVLRIGADGSLRGFDDGLASDEAYLREAKNSVAAWTFAPAVCNGTPIDALARVDFEFRREGPVSFKTGSYFDR